MAVTCLALENPGSILVARPWKELIVCIQDRELPSFALIARAIKTLVLYALEGTYAIMCF